MKELGVEQVYIDRMSGKNTNRPELTKMMSYVRQGDTVIVESISRFARNTKDLLELVKQLTSKQVEFISKKQSTPPPLQVSLCLQYSVLLQSLKENTSCGGKKKVLP